MFYDLKISQTKNYSGSYLFENPLDSNYVHDKYLESFGPGFFTGGQQKHHDTRTIDNFNVKFDFNWQINNSHNLKTGLNFKKYDIDNSWRQIRNEYFGTPLEGQLYKPKVFGDSTLFADVYTAQPQEFLSLHSR